MDRCQPSILTDEKQHALFLWLTLTPPADPVVMREVFQVVASLQQYVDKLDGNRPGEEIWAGVGFGPEIWSKMGGRTGETFEYKDRIFGDSNGLRRSDGDVFVHAKSDQKSKLINLAELIIKDLPEGKFEYEDIYGFVYKEPEDYGTNNHRDLSGFIDGTANPKNEDKRKVAVVPETGGSYVLTTKWIHNLEGLRKEKVALMEEWIGRRMKTGEELRNKAVTAHIARMRGGAGFRQEGIWPILRQSMPFGSLSENVTGRMGLFFIGYSSSARRLDQMLDSMVEAGQEDDLFLMSTFNDKGMYWYFPGEQEMFALTK